MHGNWKGAMDSITSLEERIRTRSAKAVAAMDEDEWHMILDELRVALHEYKPSKLERVCLHPIR